MSQPSAVQERNNCSFFLGENTVETPRLLLPVLNLATPERLERDGVCFSILSPAVNDKEDLCALEIKTSRNTIKTTSFKPVPPS